MTGCPCACNSGGFCGGCGHAGCGGRATPRRDHLRPYDRHLTFTSHDDDARTLRKFDGR